MKLLPLSACLLLAVCMVGQSSSKPQIITLHSSSVSIDLFAFSNSKDIFMNVVRTDNPGGNGTFLSFDIHSFSNDIVTDTFGSGQIPNLSLTGDNTKHLSLSVDTSQLSSFQTTSCTLNSVTSTQTCQPGPVGLIQLDFQQDGAFSVRNISDSMLTFFQFTEHDQRNSDAASAFANGSLLGIPVSNGSSEIDLNRDTAITITSNH
ncbi:MAG TPA: hypothetical protein VJA94_01755 [Candidatus Angelobacter sp.]